MSEKLKNFLKGLGEDPAKLEKFRNDPEGVMDEHGLEEEHKELVRKGDKDRLKEEGGLDDAETNMVVF